MAHPHGYWQETSVPYHVGLMSVLITEWAEKGQTGNHNAFYVLILKTHSFLSCSV